MSIKVVKAGKLGDVVEYKVHDVRGDGNCFYRAIFHLLQEASDEVKEDIGIDGYDALDASDEDDGVEVIRMIVAGSIRSKLNDDSLATIDNLCSLIEDTSVDKKQELLEQLNEMYPFLTTKVCSKKGDKRYELVANMIEDMDKPMFASSLEVNHIKYTLSRANGANITVLTINANGSLQSSEKKWRTDLMKLLENTTTYNVVVMLNVDNIHYQYLSFKADEDNTFHTIINRLQMLRLLSIGDIQAGLGKLTINGGSQPIRRKNKRLRLSVSALMLKHS